MTGRSALATDFYWTGPGSGAFEDPNSWTPNNPPQGQVPPPGVNDAANFSNAPGTGNLQRTYTVSISGDSTLTTSTGDNVTLNLGGNYSTGAFNGGSPFAFTGSGTFSTNSIGVSFDSTIASGVTVADRGSGLAITAITGSQKLIFNGGPLTVGGVLTLTGGVLQANNGTVVTSDSGIVRLGNSNADANPTNTAPFTSTLAAGSQWNIANGLSFSGGGQLTVSTGATLTAASLNFTQDQVPSFGSGGELFVNGGQATISGLVQGEGGSISLLNAAKMSTVGVLVDLNGTVSGNVSLWSNNGDFVLGLDSALDAVTGGSVLRIDTGGRLANTGDLIVAQGASTTAQVQLVTAGLLGNRNATVGAGVGSTGEVDLSDGGTQWSNTGDLTVGG